MFAFLLWCILFVLCWPLALVALSGLSLYLVVIAAFSNRRRGECTAYWKSFFSRSRCPSVCWPRHFESRRPTSVDDSLARSSLYWARPSRFWRIRCSLVSTPVPRRTHASSANS